MEELAAKTQKAKQQKVKQNKVQKEKKLKLQLEKLEKEKENKKDEETVSYGEENDEKEEELGEAIEEEIEEIEEEIEEKENVFFVVGAFEGYTQAKIKELIKKNGGIVATTLSDKCTHLLIADIKSKREAHEKAKSMGLTIVGLDYIKTLSK